MKLFPILIVTAASVGTSMEYFRGVSPNYFYTILMTGSSSHNNSDNRVKRMYGQGGEGGTTCCVDNGQDITTGYRHRIVYINKHKTFHYMPIR